MSHMYYRRRGDIGGGFGYLSLDGVFLMTEGYVFGLDRINAEDVAMRSDLGM